MQRRTLIGALSSLPLTFRAAHADVPRPIAANLVTAAPAHWNGHDCLAVELTDAEQALRLAAGQGGGYPADQGASLHGNS